MQSSPSAPALLGQMVPTANASSWQPTSTRLGASPNPQLTLLNGFDFTFCGERVHLPPCEQRLLALLAIHLRPLLRSFVAGTLWPDSPEAQSRANLRSALWRIRRQALVVRASSESLWLDSEVGVDLHGIVSRAQAVLAGQAPASLETVYQLVTLGDVLPEWYDDFVILERERFRQLRVLALEAVAEQLVQEGLFRGAVLAALAAVQLEPLRDSGHATLIKVHLAQGNRAEAIRQYHTYCRVLREELGLSPSPQVERLLHDLPVRRPAHAG